ncbi:unnamed protein product [Tilletia controversa]|nr:unnamed protein product [Tilletia controversa]
MQTRGAAAAAKAAEVAATAAAGQSSTSGPSPPKAGSHSGAAQKEVSKDDEPESDTQLSDILEDFSVEKRLDKIPQASRLPIPDPKFRLFYRASVTPGELNKFFRDQAVAGFVKAVRNPRMKQREQQKRDGLAVPSGDLFFDSYEAAEAAFRTYGTTIIQGKPVEILLSHRNFLHLSSVPLGSHGKEEIAAEIAKNTSSTPSVRVSPLPRAWDYNDVVTAFGDHKTICGMQWRTRPDGMAEWTLQFLDPTTAAKTIMRFKNQRITTVCWAGSEAAQGASVSAALQRRSPTLQLAPSSSTQPSGSSLGKQRREPTPGPSSKRQRT